MTPLVTWLLILLVAAAIVFVAEVFIPSHGVLSVVGILLLLAAVGVGFAIHRWAGVGLAAAMVLAAPFAASAGVSLWIKSPVGRRMMLTTTSGVASKPDVLIGETAVAVTDLRPMGECETRGSRLECTAEMGQIVPAGTVVKILSIQAGVATVRPTTTRDA
jgi:membrane-bound serine protease (ClpP class)